jgi:hypothetical protein
VRLSLLFSCLLIKFNPARQPPTTNKRTNERTNERTNHQPTKPGALLYEMLTGLPPFYCRDREKLFEKIRTAELTFPKFVSAPARCVGSWDSWVMYVYK